MGEKILAIQGNSFKNLNIITDTTYLLALEAQRRNYKHVFDAFGKIVNKEGITSLWRGSKPTMLRAMSLNVGMLSLGYQSKEFYKKITRRSGKHVARTVVGKELAKIVWHMLSKNEEYKGFKGRMTKVTTHNYWPQPISPNV